jgi:uncharacterized protein
MEYRTFANTGEKISLLGFGTMRLPILDEDSGRIDEPEAIRMIRHAIDSGVNYMDTAYMYHNGFSEVVLGKALKDGYREKVFLADKLPVWYAKKESDLDLIFDKQLKRLDVDYIDFYLVHNLEQKVWEKVKKLKTLPFLEKMKAQGRIGKIGFSFHDDLDLFKSIVDEYPWEFCQIQLNYMDVNYQAGVEGLKYAGNKGLPVIIMEPLKGGKLTESVPESIQALWDQAPVQRTPAEWALRFIADFPEVLTILSGMSTMEQVEENIRVLSDAKVGSLTEEEHRLIKEAAHEYNRLIMASCTNCRYCLPCPQNISIPDAMDFYNQWHLYHSYTPIKRDFDIVMSAGRRPSDCIDCKACEERCPQHLPITDILRKTAEIFE